MASVYSVRMYGGPVTTTGGVQLGQVPAGKVWIVRDISVSNVSPNPMNQIIIYVLLTAGNADVYRAPGIPARGSVQWQGRQVLNPGEELWYYATETTARVMISGYELTAV